MSFFLGLLVRAGVTAFVVVGATVAAEVAGPFWGGLIVSLPVAAGPAYVMLALQHDAAFIAASALNSLAVNAASFVFLAALALLALRVRWWWALVGSLGAWTGTVLLIRQVEWDVVGAIVLNVAAILVCLVLTRSVEREAVAPGGPVRRRWFELAGAGGDGGIAGGRGGHRQPGARAGADRHGGGVPGGVHQFRAAGAASGGWRRRRRRSW